MQIKRHVGLFIVILLCTYCKQYIVAPINRDVVNLIKRLLASSVELHTSNIAQNDRRGETFKSPINRDVVNQIKRHVGLFNVILLCTYCIQYSSVVY